MRLWQSVRVVKAHIAQPMVIGRPFLVTLLISMSQWSFWGAHTLYPRLWRWYRSSWESPRIPSPEEGAFSAKPLHPITYLSFSFVWWMVGAPVSLKKIIVMIWDLMDLMRYYNLENHKLLLFTWQTDWVVRTCNANFYKVAAFPADKLSPGPQVEALNIKGHRCVRLRYLPSVSSRISVGVSRRLTSTLRSDPVSICWLKLWPVEKIP